MHLARARERGRRTASRDVRDRVTVPGRRGPDAVTCPHHAARTPIYARTDARVFARTYARAYKHKHEGMQPRKRASTHAHTRARRQARTHARL